MCQQPGERPVTIDVGVPGHLGHEGVQLARAPRAPQCQLDLQPEHGHDAADQVVDRPARVGAQGGQLGGAGAQPAAPPDGF